MSVFMVVTGYLVGATNHLLRKTLARIRRPTMRRDAVQTGDHFAKQMVDRPYCTPPHVRHSEERNKARRMNLGERKKREARYVRTQLCETGSNICLKKSGAYTPRPRLFCLGRDPHGLLCCRPQDDAEKSSAYTYRALGFFASVEILRFSLLKISG